MQFAIQVGGGQVRRDKTGIEAIVEEAQLAESLGFSTRLRARPLRLRGARARCRRRRRPTSCSSSWRRWRSGPRASGSAATSRACSSAIPAMHARLFAQVDEASGGRVIAGVGAGWTRAEFAMMGLPFPDVSERLRIMDEAVAVMRGLWREEPFSFAGTYFQVTDAVCRPRPVQQPGPPIMLGGSGNGILRRAGAWADIIHMVPVLGPAGTTTLDEIAGSTTTGCPEKLCPRARRRSRGGPRRKRALRIDRLQLRADRVRGAHRAIAEGLGDVFGLPADALRRHPIALVGTPDEMIAELRRRERVHGLSLLAINFSSPAAAGVRRARAAARALRSRSAGPGRAPKWGFDPAVLWYPSADRTEGGPCCHGSTVARARLRHPRASRTRAPDHAPGAARAFTTFETGQVRPLALSPDGTRLFAVNTPDDRLEIFTVSGGRPHPHRLRPGRPRAGRRRRALEHARSGWSTTSPTPSASSTSATTPPRVTRTLLVGDEPRDIVFAGPGGNRAFITTAHRGQNCPGDPQLTTPGDRPRRRVGVRRDQPRHAALGGTPLTIARRCSATRRARSPSRPAAAPSTPPSSTPGNQTTTLSERLVCNGGAAAGPCTVERREHAGRPPGAEHQLPGHAAARGRPHRQVQQRDATTGRTSSAATGTTPCASPCPTSTSSRSTPTPARRRRPPASPTSAPSSSTWWPTR